MEVAPYFANRPAAGRELAAQLAHYAGRTDVLVLALPRGGVPVGFEVARALRAPLDPFLVRKLGVPGHEELAMGAVASGGVRVLNQDVIDELRISPGLIADVAAAEARVLAQRERDVRGLSTPVDPRGRVVIIVDDGLATGSTMRAAAAAVRARQPSWIVVAVPVAARQTRVALASVVDEVVCVLTPEPFYAVGVWYADFTQTTDDEVRRLLEHQAR